LSGINGAATRESGEPDHLPGDPASLGENSVWYRWTAPISGQVNMDTCTSSFDSALAAYTGGTTFPALTQVASDDDACTAPNGRGSRISFNAVAGTNYNIAVSTTRSGNEGTFDRLPSQRTATFRWCSPATPPGTWWGM
jgi:hypothetical protein